MAIHEHAGKTARPQDRTNIAKLVSDYFVLSPDMSKVEQRVAFGTSGHRGSATKISFNECHIFSNLPSGC